MSKWPYGTKRWHELRALKLAKQPVCEMCGEDQFLQVHHVEPLTVQDRFNRYEPKGYPPLSRLSVLCRDCHSVTTKHRNTNTETQIRADWAAFNNKG